MIDESIDYEPDSRRECSPDREPESEPEFGTRLIGDHDQEISDREVDGMFQDQWDARQAYAEGL